MVGDQVREFQTAKWSGLQKWPEELVPLTGFILGADKKPKTPAFPDKPFMQTKIPFERVVISLRDFQADCMSRVLDAAGTGNPEMRKKKILLYAFAHLGLATTSLVENARKFDGKKIRHLRTGSPALDGSGSINFSRKPKGWQELSDEDVWFKLLPDQIEQAFLPVTSSTVPSPEERAKIEQFLEELYEPYFDGTGSAGKRHSAQKDSTAAWNFYDASQRSFERALNAGWPGKSLAAYVASFGWQYLHYELEKSTLCLCEVLRTWEKFLVSPDATQRYLRFWYTSQGPWALGLKGYTPALGEAIPSIYSALKVDSQEKFDRAVFIEDRTPPRDVLDELYVNAATHASTVHEIRFAERKAKREKRHDPKIKVDETDPAKKARRFVRDFVEVVGDDALRPSTRAALGFSHINDKK